MPDRELKYKVTYEEDKQSVANLGKSQTAVLSGGGNTNQPTAIDKSLVQANKLQDRFKLLNDAQKQLASQPGMERSLAKVNQELAGAYGSQKRMATTVDGYIKNLEKEVVLRKQARDLINNSEGGNNQYSAHSQRQMQYLQQIVGKAPGGNVFNQFIGGSSRAVASAESGGASGLEAAGMGLAGGGMAAGAGAAAAAVALVVSAFGQLGDRAKELASTSGTASSQLGQLRASIEKAGIAKDAAATSPGVVGFQKFVTDVGVNIGDAISHATSTAPDRAKALSQKFADGLGSNNEDWRRMKEAGADLIQDQGIQKQALQTKWQRTERDFDLTQRKFQVDSANQVFDLQKQASRQQWDQTLAVTKFQENFANQQSAKAFAQSQQFAQQGYQIQVGRTVQDYNLNKQYQTQDFSRNKQYQGQDFAISQSRAQTSRGNQLFDMAMGGANGLQYLQASRDYNQQQQYAKQDFALSQKREQEQFDISQGRNKTALGINLSRGAQDFSQSQRQALAGRQLEVEAQEYARKYEGIQLQENLNRQTQDLQISFQRLNQSLGFQKQGLANTAADMAYDKRLDFSNLALQQGRQQRNYQYGLQDFAKSARDADPLGAAGLGSRDATFADALGKSAQSRGQTDLFKQVNDTVGITSPGGKFGDIVKSLVTDVLTQTLDGLNLDKNPNAFSLNPADWFKSTPKLPNVPDMSNPFDKSYQDELNGKGPGGSNTSINANVNVTGIGQDAVQKIVNDAVAAMGDAIAKQMMRNYGG